MEKLLDEGSTPSISTRKKDIRRKPDIFFKMNTKEGVEKEVAKFRAGKGLPKRRQK